MQPGWINPRASTTKGRDKSIIYKKPRQEVAAANSSDVRARAKKAREAAMASSRVYPADSLGSPSPSAVERGIAVDHAREGSIRKQASAFAAKIGSQLGSAAGTAKKGVRFLRRGSSAQHLDSGESFWRRHTGDNAIMRASQRFKEEKRQRRQTMLAERREKKARRRSSVANERLQAFIDHRVFMLTMALFTVFALFGDDIRLASCPKSSDPVFYLLSTITLFMFCFEVIITHFARTDYTNSFYFWLDFVAAISIIPDIGWIWEPLTGTGDGQGSDAGQEALRAGRASRAGTRAGRLVRIIRLVRLVRVVKLYKVTVGGDKMAGKGMKHQIQDRPSKVGQKMSEMTTRRVIMLVLVLILVLPFFDGGLEERINQFQSYGINQLHRMPQDRNKTATERGQPISDDIMRLAVEQYASEAGKLLYLELCMPPSMCYSGASVSKAITDEWLNAMRFEDGGVINQRFGWQASDMYPSISRVLDNYRSIEITSVWGVGCYTDSDGRMNASLARDACRSRAIFDKREDSIMDANMNMIKTCFIMAVLAFGAISFSRIAQALVISPIERMMQLVKMLARNPLDSTTQVTGQGSHGTVDGQQSTKAGYETLLLENTLAKIGALMQVGFGAAGAEIIGKNMGSGELDPMVPGKKIVAIYGFSDIRQFTDTTECLQEEVMVFVNKLGGIVHGSSHDYYGMANKNVGDAFLVSWKLRNGTLPGFSAFEDKPTEEARQATLDLVCPPAEGAGNRKRSLHPTEMAESALTAFLRIIVDMHNANTDGCLAQYASDPRVIERFGRDYRIRMGFGIHVGWAIEGAIGSAFKIDATYISPHVEMSDRLEAASKVYGTPLIMSEWFVGLLSPKAQSFLRRLDCIKVRGCSVPFTVYTFDVKAFPQAFAEPQYDEYGQQIPVNFNDVQYAQLQRGLSPHFFAVYEQAYEAYIDGRWAASRRHLEQVLEMQPDDGPSKNLMRVMNELDNEHNNMPPRDWDGFRHLPDF